MGQTSTSWYRGDAVAPAATAEAAAVAVFLLRSRGQIRSVNGMAADLLTRDEGGLLPACLADPTMLADVRCGVPYTGQLVLREGCCLAVTVLPHTEGFIAVAVPVPAVTNPGEASGLRPWFEPTPAMVAWLDHRGRCVAFNNLLRERLGYEPDEIRHRPMLELVLESQRAEVAERFAPDAVPELVEFRIVTASGGYLDVEMSHAAVRDAVGRVRGYVIFLRDIGRRRALALELEQYTHQLERLFIQLEQRTVELEAANEATRRARLETLAAEELARLEQMKTAFLDVAAHELRTPVTLITGLLSCLSDSTPPELRANLVNGAQRAGQRLAAILDNALKLLQSGQPGFAGEFGLWSLADVLRRAAADAQPFVTLRGQQLEVDLAPDLPPAWIDPEMIHDIALNLLMNAVKFTPDGGRLRLVSEPGEPGWVRFTVSDEGIGIDRHDLPHIFERFFCSLDSRHHSSGEYEFNKRGPGFGLAIVSKFVDLHGGRVTVANGPEAGCSFTIDLPLGPS